METKKTDKLTMREKQRQSREDGKEKAQAFISIMLDDDDRCKIHFKGETVQLADMIYTTLNKSHLLAAVICQAAKDFIDGIKGDRARWIEMTKDCAYVQTKLTDRYGTPTVKEN